jgi:hypothetical protein
MSTIDSLALIGAIVVIVVPLAGLIWYIINHRSEWKKIFLAGVVTVLVMAALLVGVNAVASHYAPSTPSPTPLSQGTVGAISSSPSSRGVTSTPTPEVIPINQTMNCTNNCDPSFFNFSLKVKNATIDSAKGQVTLLIEVDNIGSTSQTDVFFTYLKLQDLQTAVTTNGGGDGFRSFDVAANASQLVVPTFQFIPVVGHEYSLTASLSVYYIFSPITIKFG